MRDSSYYLINAHELSPSYDNTVTFNNKQNQLAWFMNKKIYSFTETQYLRKTREIIVVPLHIDSINMCNYVITHNKNRYYYYFIINKEYLSENSCAITLKLDVIQTYLFDITFGKHKSLIDRSHVHRYFGEGQPVVQNLVVPEDLEIGEYVEVNRTTIYDYTNQGGYVVTSSDKLTADNGGSSGSGTGINNKLVSANGFVLIKCTEAFSSTPYNIGDGTNTIGYGVTEKYQPLYYNELAPECTEQQASEVLGKVVDNFSLQVYNTMQSYGKDMSTVKQQEFDAFVSLAYNSGVSGMANTQIFIDYCNNVSRETIYTKWLTTLIMEGSAYEEGLRDRRLREATVFRDGVYNLKSIGIVGGGTVTGNDGKGYIPSKYLTTQVQGTDIVASARKLIGMPYVWGGNVSPLGSDNGTDCSGLVQWAYNDNGIKTTRTTYTQIYEGYEVLQSAVQLGDLVFSNFSSPNVPEHVYIYSGYDGTNHKCIEAPTTGQLIKERTFTFTSEMRVRRLL